MQKISLLLAAALLLSPLVSFTGEEADALGGVWNTAEGRAQVWTKPVLQLGNR